MAKLSFFKGAITGKLGEFVGAKWKGINYLRLYAKPANPRTEGQISIRLVFKALSLFATALFSKGLLELIPPARRMTERNSVFKANKQMLSDKVFVPAALQVAKANVNSAIAAIACSLTNNLLTSATNLRNLDDIEDGNVYAIVYDFVKGLIISTKAVPIVNGAAEIVGELPTPADFNTPDGSQQSDCRLFVFAAGTGADGKKLISETYSTGIA